MRLILRFAYKQKYGVNLVTYFCEVPYNGAIVRGENMKNSLTGLIIYLLLFSISNATEYDNTKTKFLNLPLSEKLTGPLFWQQEAGNTDAENIHYVQKIIEGGNGHLTIESRVHQDWLGPTWFDDVDLILNETKNRGAKAYIFDEAWFPSFDVAGQVPQQYRTKLLNHTAVDQTGPTTYTASGHSGTFYIKTVAGLVNGAQIDADNLVDLTPYITNGNLNWNVPAGTWRIMKFTWSYNTSWGNTRLLDLASQDAADWFINTVVKPHYDNTTAPDAIAGFFYDEPEFFGQWGKGMENDTPYWKEMLVHRFYTLTGEAQKKAQYVYMDRLADRMGRVGYGTYKNYVNSRGGKVIGHFWEHNHPLTWGVGAIDIMEVQKYSDMGGIDYVVPGQAAPSIRSKTNGHLYQMGRLGASISVSNNMDQHHAMNEAFAGYTLSDDYASIKWSSDLSTIQGAQVIIPHSFNPGNYHEDWQPWFYKSGQEPTWPIYKIWAERQNRLAYMMSGNDVNNYRISPVAVIWGGIASHVGNYTIPYDMLSALESANYDPILVTSDRLATTATINVAEKSIELYNSKYKILVLPAAEFIPYDTLLKAQQFYDNGGIVIGHVRVPTKSAKFDATDADIQNMVTYLFNSTNPSGSTSAIKTNGLGGKTFFIGAQVNLATLTSFTKTLLANTGVDSTFKVLSGVPANEEWVVYQHRKRNGMDTFMVWNGNASEANFTARLTGTGNPEIWNPTSREIYTPTYTRVNTNTVDIDFTIPPSESLLVVFNNTGGTPPPPQVQGPTGFTWCADDGGIFPLIHNNADVAYGANGSFNYLYNQNGIITFNPTTFGGDPAPGVVKAGYCRPPGAPPGNVAASSNGGYAVNTPAGEFDANYPYEGAIDGDRYRRWGSGGGWNDATANVWNDQLHIHFDQTYTIDQIDVFTIQDNFANPSVPTPGMTFSTYGITDFNVAYWDGASWVQVGSVSNNNKVWNQFTFSPITTDQIMITVFGGSTYSRILEVEAWKVNGVNVAASSNGGTAVASSAHSSGNFPASGANNGDTYTGWESGGGWNDDTQNVWGDSLQVNFLNNSTIDMINVYTLQDNYSTGGAPDLNTTFTLYGITDFTVQYLSGSTWLTIPGGNVTNNNKVWRQFTFSPITTSAIRVVVNNGLAGYSRIMEIEAF